MPYKRVIWGVTPKQRAVFAKEHDPAPEITRYVAEIILQLLKLDRG